MLGSVLQFVSYCEANLKNLYQYLSRDVTKPAFGVSDQVGHKPICTVIEAGYKLEILDLRRREIVLSV